MNPTQVIECQLDLLAKLRTDEGFRYSFRGLLEASAGRAEPGDPSLAAFADPRRKADAPRAEEAEAFIRTRVGDPRGIGYISSESGGELLFPPERQVGALRPLLGDAAPHRRFVPTDAEVQRFLLATPHTARVPGVDPDAVLRQAIASAQAAYAYRVSPDMSKLVAYAAEKLGDDETVDLELAPTQCGLVRFDSPLEILELRGRTMLAHWALWGPGPSIRGRATYYVHFFNDILTEPDEVVREMASAVDDINPGVSLQALQRLRGRWDYIGAETLVAGDRLGPWRRDVDPATRALFAEAGVSVTQPTNNRAFIVALWSMLNQTITDVSEGEVKRAKRDQIRKARIPGRVTVIQLRRLEGVSRGAGETQVEWQHRWMVRGHWRNQAFGTGRSERRRIWIHPFWKGDPNAPVTQTEKVYDLSR
jgi:hypothetical protein